MGIQLSIVTPERAVFDGDVDFVYAPGAEGEFGVLVAHEPFLAPLRPGVVRFEGSGGSGRLAVASGFAEVTGERVTLLVQTAERTSEIDRPRAEEALRRAEEAIREAGSLAPEEERVRLEEARARAEARLAVSAS